jgi:hypothetical protein
MIFDRRGFLVSLGFLVLAERAMAFCYLSQEDDLIDHVKVPSPMDATPTTSLTQSNCACSGCPPGKCVARQDYLAAARSLAQISDAGQCGNEEISFRFNEALLNGPGISVHIFVLK